MFFPKEKRFEPDPRFIYIDTLAQMKKCRRSFNKVSGTLLPFNPLCEWEMEEIMGYARSKITPDLPRFEATMIRDHHKTVRWKELGQGYPESLDTIFDTMAMAYDLAFGGTPQLAKFRVNVNLFRDGEPHHHDGIVYILNGEGMEGIDERGAHYRFPTHHIAAIKDGVDHLTPKYEETHENPRLAFVYG